MMLAATPHYSNVSLDAGKQTMLAATFHYSNVSLDAFVLLNMCIISLPVFRLTPVVRPLTRSHVLYPPRHTSNLFLRPRPPLNVNTHANENAPLLFLCS